MSSVTVLLVSLLMSILAAPAIAQQEPQPPAQPPGPVRLDLRINSFIDMHFFVRSQLDKGPADAGRGDQPDPAAAIDSLNGLAAAIDAARSLEADLGGPRGWAFIEPALAACSSSAQAVAACARLPDSFKPQSGPEIPIRAGALRLAQAYETLEPHFLESLWPAHHAAIETARDRLGRTLLARQDECYIFITESLAMIVSDIDIPVYLTAQAPRPGGVTHRGRSGGVCFIGIEHAPGTLLEETVIHESIHALDLATQSQDTVLQSLRRRLADAGVDRSDAAYRDVPHTLMFVHSACAARRFIDPAHQDYGDAAGYYARVPAATAAVRPLWTAFLDSAATDPSPTLDQIVAAFMTDAPPQR